MTAARDTLFSVFPTSFPAPVSLHVQALYANNIGKPQLGMNGLPWVGGHARHTPKLPPHFPVTSGVPASTASWLCPSLAHSGSSSFSSSSSSLLLTPPRGATMASFVGLGQRPELSPQSPTRYFPTLSGCEHHVNEAPAKKAERKYVLLRNAQGWYYNVPESTLEASPEVAPRVIPRVRMPGTPLLSSCSLPPSPPLPLVTVSPHQGLGLQLSVTDNIPLSSAYSRASGTTLVSSSGSSCKTPPPPLKEESHPPLWDATGLRYSPGFSGRSKGLEVGLQLVSSWSPSPTRLRRTSTLAPQQRPFASGLNREPFYPPGLAPKPNLSSVPLAVTSAFAPPKNPLALQELTHSIAPLHVSCYDPNDEIVTPPKRTVHAATIRSKFAGFVPTHGLAAGAQGRVVRVEHWGTGKAYAMKVVHKGLAATRKFSRRNFLTERNVMLSVNESETAGRFLMSVLMSWEDVEKDLIYFVMVSVRLCPGLSPMYSSSMAASLSYGTRHCAAAEAEHPHAGPLPVVQGVGE